MASNGPHRITYRLEELKNIRDNWVDQFGPFPEPSEVSEFNAYLIRQKAQPALQAIAPESEEKKNLPMAKL